jgi:hypothetical protein
VLAAHVRNFAETLAGEEDQTSPGNAVLSTAPAPIRNLPTTIVRSRPVGRPKAPTKKKASFTSRAV